jgi:phosphate starvation-inducible protein PhoH
MSRVARKNLRELKESGIVYEINPKQVKSNLRIQHVTPLTENQRLTFESYNNDKNILLHGLAGTGKTFISMYLALNEILSKNSVYKKLIIIRSIVPTRDIGFLPGNTKEKTKVYEGPYYAICTELFGRGDSYEILKTKGVIDFMSTSFIRGMTLTDSIVIVDEINNLTFHELDTVITRLGNNCKLLLCGDFRQSDLTKQSDRKGLTSFMSILSRMDSFDYVEFSEEDIVRSGLVKEYIIAKDKLGYSSGAIPV